MKTLSLPSYGSSIETTNQLVVNGFPFYRTYESAGRMYQQLRLIHHSEEEDLAAVFDEWNSFMDELQDKESETTFTPQEKKPASSQPHHKPSKVDLLKKDYYEVLGLGHLRFEATHEQIRKNYRQKVLEYHPDHYKEDTEGTMFKLVQEAYEVLSNEKKRREYDSIDNVDEDELDVTTIPTSQIQKQFYETMGSLFMKWSKWSQFKPVPKLGDENTPWKQVEQFYKFWSSFKSWRDFAHEDEHDLDHAESRDERRWMERQNEKLRSEKKKQEKESLRKLVEVAMKYDPRVRQKRQQEEDEKQKIKDAKKEKKRMAADEVKKREMEEQLKKEMESKRIEEEKKRKEQELKNREIEVASQLANLRKICQPYIVYEMPRKKKNDTSASQVTSILAEDLEYLIIQMNNVALLEKVKQLIADLSSNPTTIAPTIDSMVKDFRNKEEEKKQQKQQQQQQSSNIASSNTNSKEWTRDELALLAKGVAQYPGGTLQRWQKIADFVGTRTPEEVQAKTNEVKKISQSKVSSSTDQSFHDFQESKKKTETAKKKDEEVKASVPQQPATSSPKPTAPASPTSSVENWSNEQQKQLENGIRTFKAEKDENKKWEEIAKTIPGKSPQDCLDRFNYCKKLALEKRKAAAK